MVVLSSGFGLLVDGPACAITKIMVYCISTCQLKLVTEDLPLARHMLLDKYLVFEFKLPGNNHVTTAILLWKFNYKLIRLSMHVRYVDLIPFVL